MTRAPQSESMEQRTHRILQSPFCHSAFRSERQEISIIAWPLATLLGGSALLRSLWKAYLLRFAFSSPGEAVFNRSAVSFIGALLIFVIPFAETFAAQSNWKEEWEESQLAFRLFVAQRLLELDCIAPVRFGSWRRKRRCTAAPDRYSDVRPHTIWKHR